MKWLSYDSKLITMLSAVADAIFVNLLYLLCCIPIITIGPARTALYTVTASWAEKENSGAKDFLVAFGKNFRSSCPLWLAALALGIFLIADFYFMLLNTIPMEILLWFLLLPLTVFYLVALSQLFMVEARFSCSFRQSIKNALLIGIAHPVCSILHIALLAVPLVVFLWWPEMFLELGLLWLLFYFSLEGYFDALIAKKHYDKLAKKA